MSAIRTGRPANVFSVQSAYIHENIYYSGLRSAMIAAMISILHLSLLPLDFVAVFDARSHNKFNGRAVEDATANVHALHLETFAKI